MKPDDMAALDVDGQSGFLQQEDTGNRVCFTSRYYSMSKIYASAAVVDAHWGSYHSQLKGTFAPWLKPARQLLTIHSSTILIQIPPSLLRITY